MSATSRQKQDDKSTTPMYPSTLAHCMHAQVSLTSLTTSQNWLMLMYLLPLCPLGKKSLLFSQVSVSIMLPWHHGPNAAGLSIRKGCFMTQ